MNRQQPENIPNTKSDMGKLTNGTAKTTLNTSSKKREIKIHNKKRWTLIEWESKKRAKTILYLSRQILFFLVVHCLRSMPVFGERNKIKKKLSKQRKWQRSEKESECRLFKSRKTGEVYVFLWSNSCLFVVFVIFFSFFFHRVHFTLTKFLRMVNRNL